MTCKKVCSSICTPNTEKRILHFSSSQAPYVFLNIQLRNGRVTIDLITFQHESTFSITQFLCTKRDAQKTILRIFLIEGNVIKVIQEAVLVQLYCQNKRRAICAKKNELWSLVSISFISLKKFITCLYYIQAII